MHTSTRLAAGDFHYYRHTDTGTAAAPFADFCPAYHPQDRIGVVSPWLETGVAGASYALLALTTAFYDQQRATARAFFDYPQHFAIVGASAPDRVASAQGSLPSDTPGLWDAWSWLDVWPASQWVTAPPTATALLERVFATQINRLFWPHNLWPGADEPPLPSYVGKLLRARLKTVYLYGASPDAPGHARFDLCAAPAAQTLLQESLAQLPGAQADAAPVATSQVYAMVGMEMFLRKLGAYNAE
jgi:hypothetical protein